MRGCRTRRPALVSCCAVARICRGKDDVVVEYAMSRSLSPALVADYQLALPSRQLLHDKWQELLMLADSSDRKE